LNGITSLHHENIPGGSKDTHRSFIPEASIAFRSFLPYSEQLALVSMVTSLTAFLSFLPYIKVHALVTMVKSAEDGM
jgi:hypothetical protein